MGDSAAVAWAMVNAMKVCGLLSVSVRATLVCAYSRVGARNIERSDLLPAKADRDGQRGERNEVRVSIGSIVVENQVR